MVAELQDEAADEGGCSCAWYCVDGDVDTPKEAEVVAVIQDEWEKMTVAEEEELLEDTCAQYVLQHMSQAMAEGLTAQVKGEALVNVAAHLGNEEAQRCCEVGMWRYILAKIQDEVQKGIAIEEKTRLEAILKMLEKRVPQMAQGSAACEE